VQDAIHRGEQAVDDVRVVLHRQVEKLDDSVDRDVVGAPTTGEGIRVLDVVLLVLLKAVA